MPALHRYMGKGCSLQPYYISALHGGHVTYQDNAGAIAEEQKPATNSPN